MYKEIKNKISIIYSLQMLDFIFTWIGIHVYGIIEEGNPFMIWLFNLPLLKASLVRWFLVTVLSIVFYYVYTKKIKYFNFLFIFSLIANIAIMLLHALWIFLFWRLGIFTIWGFFKVLVLYILPFIPMHIIASSLIDVINIKKME